MKNPILVKLDNFFSRYPSASYKKRENVLLGNDQSPSIFYIVNGAVKTFLITKDGKELTHTLLGPRNLFPLRGTHYGNIPKYTFQALTNTEIKKAPKEDYLAWIKENPDVFSYVMEELLTRLNSSVSRLQSLLMGNAFEKVASILLFVGENLGYAADNKIDISIILTHQEIADMAGLTRETVTLEIEKLRKEGYIELDNGHFLIHPSLKEKASIFE